MFFIFSADRAFNLSAGRELKKVYVELLSQSLTASQWKHFIQRPLSPSHVVYEKIGSTADWKQWKTKSANAFRAASRCIASHDIDVLRFFSVGWSSRLMYHREGFMKRSCCSFGSCPNEGRGRALPNFLSPFHKCILGH